MASSFLIFLLLMMTLAFIGKVHGFENGAPYGSCSNNVPHHNDLEPTQTPSPYDVSTDKSSYRPGEVITVTLSSPGGKAFTGFQVRASRVIGDTEDIVGSFITVPEDSQLQRWYSSTNQSNCVTHSKKISRSTVMFKWKAPAISVGDIQFTAGVVMSFEEFWIISSGLIKAVSPSMDQAFTSQVSPFFDPPIDITTCGKTKGCLIWPRACTGTSCKTVVTYQTVEGGTVVDFEILASTPAYVSIGFSHDPKMGEDETYMCGVAKNFFGIQHGFNPAYYNHVHRIVGTTNMQLTKRGGKVMCRFRRPIKTILSTDGSNAPTKDLAFDLNNDYYLQVAVGDMYLGTPSAHAHKVLPLVSEGKVDFQSKSITYGQMMYTELRVHAFMMITSWLLLAGFTKIISANFKESWKRNLLGVGAWFQLHRACSIVVAVLTSVGNIIIFVYLKKISPSTVVHAVCGIVVWCMLVLQMVFGLIRPEKDSKYRPAWYWMHFIWGHVMHILAAVTMFLSVQTRLFDDDFRSNVTVLLVCWVSVHVVWEMVFSALKRTYSGKSEEVAMTITAEELKAPAGESKKCNGLTVCFVLYVISMVVFYAIGIYFVFTT